MVYQDTVLAENLHWHHSGSGISTQILHNSHQSVVQSHADSFYSPNVLHVLLVVTKGGIISWDRTRWWHAVQQVASFPIKLSANAGQPSRKKLSEYGQATGDNMDVDDEGEGGWRKRLIQLAPVQCL